MAAGSGVFMDHGEAQKIMVLLHAYFAPDTAGSVYQEVVRFSQQKRATPSMD